MPIEHTNTPSLEEVALSCIPGVGCVLARQLYSYLGSAEAVVFAPKAKLLKVPGIGQKLATAITDNKLYLNKAEAIVAAAQKRGDRLLYFTDKEYPQRLHHIYDSPLLLHYTGTASLNPVYAIAIVGTRKATEYGKSVLDQFIPTLAAIPGLVIFSGLAYGIDIYVHRLCLQYNIPTVAVIGSGLDQIYPAVHKKTAAAMTANGGLLTEYAAGTKPAAMHFPERNRIIAGATDATIVVEAAKKGGALITADLANDYNRDVFAFPGNIIGQSFSEGCNYLIQQNKAVLLSSAEELIALMNWDTDPTKATSPNFFPEDLSAEEKALCELLQASDMQIDDLALKSRLPVNKVAAILINLEFRDLIKALPGKRFSLLLK